jgi:GT2 family glycosyltransferase
MSEFVSIIIVTKGVKDYLKYCLESVRIQSYPNFEAIVIDNSFNQNIRREINEHNLEIKLYSSPMNSFYCQALNKGLEMSRGDFVLCLNDDVILDDRFIEESLRGFIIDEKVGMVSGKILRRDGQTIDSTGLFLTSWRTVNERGYGLKDMGQFEKEEYIFGVNGAVAFYRREMLESIKLDSDYFDSDYHIFYEDLDIAWRAQNAGWKGYYVPLAIAYHARGGTVRVKNGIGKSYARKYLNDDLNLDLIKNRYLTIIKNDSFLGFLVHMPFIFCYELLVWAYVLLYRPQLIKNSILNIRYLKSALNKRRLIRLSRR